jgi:hypothetical protein
MTNPLLLRLGISTHEGRLPAISALNQRGHDMHGLATTMAIAEQLIGYEMNNLPPYIARLSPLQRNQPTPVFHLLWNAIEQATRANFGAEPPAPQEFGWFCPEHNHRLSVWDVVINPDTDRPLAICYANDAHPIEPEARPLAATDTPDNDPLGPIAMGAQVTILRWRTPERARDNDPDENLIGRTGTVVNLHNLRPGENPGNQEIRVTIAGRRIWMLRDEIRPAPRPNRAPLAIGMRVRTTRDIIDEFDLDELLAGATGIIINDDGATYTDHDWRITLDDHTGAFTIPDALLEPAP